MYLIKNKKNDKKITLIYLTLFSIITSCSSSDSDTKTSERIISVNKTEINFGSIQKGDSAIRTLTINNDGNEPLNLQYTVPNNFSIDLNVNQNISVIPPQTSINLEIEFLPTDSNVYNSNLIISNNSNNNKSLTVNLIGEGTKLTINFDKLTLGSQQQIDNLVEADEIIVNELIIIDNVEDNTINSITNLDALSKITEVESLILWGLNNLNSISGIENINIKNNLAINSTNWTNLNLIQNLINDNISYSLISNNNLENIDAFQNIVNLRSFIINGAPNLKTLTALSNLESLNGGSLIIQQTGLNNLTGLEKLGNVTDDVTIQKNSMLNDFCAIQNIANTINITISDNLYNPTFNDFQNGQCKN